MVSKKKGAWYIILATIFFSSMEVALKLTGGQFNPIQLTFLRFLIGGLVLFPLAVNEGKKKGFSLRRFDIGFFLLTGLICVVVSMILFQLSVLYSPASAVAVLFSCNSVFVVMFAYLLLREPIRRHTVVSILVIVAGMLVIVDPLSGKGSAAGTVCVLGSAVTFALYNILGRTRSGRCGGITLTCASFFAGCAEMLAIIGLSHIPALARQFRSMGLSIFSEVPLLEGITLRTIPSLLYVGICVTGLGYTFYFLAMEATDAATAALVFYIKPVLAPLFALAVLGEAITGRMALGIVFILAGSLIAFLPVLRKGKAEPRAEDLRKSEEEFEAKTGKASAKP